MGAGNNKPPYSQFVHNLSTGQNLSQLIIPNYPQLSVYKKFWDF